MVRPGPRHQRPPWQCPLLILAYSRSSGKRPLRWDSATARTLWNQGRHFLLSGLLVALYGQTDRLMLRSMAGRPLWACTEPPGPSAPCGSLCPPLWWKRPGPCSWPGSGRTLPVFVRAGRSVWPTLVWLLPGRPGDLPAVPPAFASSLRPGVLSGLGNSMCCGLAACLLLPGHRAKYFLAAHRQFRYEKYLAAAGAAVNLVFESAVDSPLGASGCRPGHAAGPSGGQCGHELFLIPPLPGKQPPPSAGDAAPYSALPSGGA